jgi:hypothetical protein
MVVFCLKVIHRKFLNENILEIDNFETKDDHKKRSVLAKLFLPAAVISSIGFGVYTY